MRSQVEEQDGCLIEQGSLHEGRGLQAIEEVLEREEGTEVEDQAKGCRRSRDQKGSLEGPQEDRGG